MNTLKVYINEALFTDDSIDKQLDDTTGKYILNKLIEADKSLKNWGLKVSGNEINVKNNILFHPSYFYALNELYEKLNFHFNEFESFVTISEMYSNTLPGYLQNTKFNDGLLINNEYFDTLKNINISVDKNLVLDLSIVDKIENTNIEIINSIELGLTLNNSLFSSKNSSKKIIEMLNNLNLNKNKINDITFIINFNNISYLKFKSLNEVKNNLYVITDYIHNNMDYWFEKVDFLKNRKSIIIKFISYSYNNTNYEVRYNLNKKEIEWIS